MPRSGHEHVVDDAWRERVERALKERGWSRADLAREIKCSRATISHLLNGDVNQSSYVTDIHNLFEWTPPQPPMPTVATEELMEMWALLNPSGKDRLLERAHVLVEDPKLIDGVNKK